MQSRAFTLSFGVAFLAVLLVYNYVENTVSEARKPFGEETVVVVAKRDIKELDTLDETNLKLEPVPAKFVQPGAAYAIEDVRGTLAVTTIYVNEQVTRSKVTVPGVRPGLARQVAPGKRAVTIRVNDETGVAKLLKPGDRVDVAATIDPTGSGNKLALETRVILQDRLVLAIGKYVTNTVPAILEADPFQREKKSKVALSEYVNYSTITLEVEPPEVTRLIYAATNLPIYLALRNNDEIKVDVEFPKTMMRDLASPQAPAVPGAPGAAQGNTGKK